MTSPWYWLAFLAIAAAVLAGPWLCSLLEQRADERDAELWMRQPGATR